ncbi:hypothetical protein Shyhy01_21930 [Streptomyces hygroscopicus subsp. hygroscopicus]|uniref:hypothetical protein n=1 Tax=Streptomyces sp. KHY 26 TaxID=3097359 RepID=UPI0024A1DF78|nr:hypothetical protein [Streptomyces hygroscopicus]GLX49243.1 hypothetical protein Shyhy01_21930 [Streptomyces hygroscopicus subsp. hygroscopicus]
MTERPLHATTRTHPQDEEDAAPARPALRVVHEPAGIDPATAEAAAGRFLHSLGISAAS